MIDTGPDAPEVYFAAAGSGSLLVVEEAELRAVSIAQQDLYVARGGKVVFFSSAALPGAGVALSLPSDQLAPTSPVPEPSALLVAAAALLGILAFCQAKGGVGLKGAGCVVASDLQPLAIAS